MLLRCNITVSRRLTTARGDAPNSSPSHSNYVASLHAYPYESPLLVPTAPTIFSEVPANLPPLDQIVTLCKEAGYNSDGIAFADPCSREVLA